MNKDFNKSTLLKMSENKQIKVLYDLSLFIETGSFNIESNHFQKLAKYHTYLEESSSDKVQKLNLEFHKIKSINFQFQIYLMNLERLLGQSTKEYNFLVKTNDSNLIRSTFKIHCLLDSIRSAHNVGAMFRNAECFGVEKMYLCGLTPTPESIQVQKTAMDCEKSVDWQFNTNSVELVQNLKDLGHIIWSVETSNLAKNVNKIQNIPEKLVLIFGHEQFGISKELLELSDQMVSIPLHGNKNSLNVSVSQAIILNKLTAKLTD